MTDKAKKPKNSGGAGAAAIAVAAAGVGLLTGLAARAGARGVMVAAEPLSGHWLDIVKGDHLIILELVEKALSTRATAKARRALLLGRIKEALVRQTVEKEWVLYPALRLSGEAGEAAADRLATDYAEVKAALFELEQTPSEDPLWRSRVGALRDRLVAHTREEEEEVFPALRKTLTAEEDARLTQLVNVEGRRFV